MKTITYHNSITLYGNKFQIPTIPPRSIPSSNPSAPPDNKSFIKTPHVHHTLSNPKPSLNPESQIALHMVINTQKCSLSRICGRGPALVILPGRVAIHYDGTGKWSPSLHQKLKNLVYKCWPKAVDKFSPTTDAGRLLGPIEAHFRVVFEGVRPGRSVATEPHSETHSDHIKTSGPGCTHCSSWVSLLTGRIWRILNLTFSPSGVSRKGGYWSRREPSSPKTVRNGGRCEARLVVL